MLLQFSAVELLRMSGIVSRADITAHLMTMAFEKEGRISHGFFRCDYLCNLAHRHLEHDPDSGIVIR
jgi:hypothetical protein